MMRMPILAKTFNLLRYPAMAESKKTASKGRSLSINYFSSNFKVDNPILPENGMSGRCACVYASVRVIV